MTTKEIIGCVLIVLFVLYLVYEIKNAAIIPSDWSAQAPESRTKNLTK